MKLHEVFADSRVMCGDVWFRPASYKGIRYAWTTRGINTERVPGPGGGVTHMTCSVADLAGDWEIVDPYDVIEGR